MIGLRDYGRTLKEFFPTITSPVFSEIVVIFPGEVSWPRGLAEVLHEIYRIREFRLVFCLETMERSRVVDLQAFEIATRAEMAKGSYDFLPCPPVIFFRALTKYDHLTRV